MKICPECKTKIDNDNAKFCPRCRHDFTKDIADTSVNKTDEKVINSDIPTKKHVRGNGSATYVVFTVAAIFIVIGILLSTGMVSVNFNVGENSTASNDYNNTNYQYTNNTFDNDDKYNDDYEDDFDDYDSSGSNNYFVYERETTTETTTAEVKKESTYEVYFADISWDEAVAQCQAKGGHLLTIESEEEYQKIMSIISQYNNKSTYYLGGWRSVDSYDYYWIDEYGYQYGTSINGNPHWLPGEPTYYDEASGLTEDCIVMFYQSSSSQWLYNDIPADYLSVADYKRGRIAYICEYD